jgi:membrane fusion protein, multidrug efflux system
MHPSAIHRVLLLCCGATALLAACSGTSDARASGTASRTAGAEPPGATVTAESTTVATPTRLSSQLYVEQDAAIGARAAGVLRVLSVDLGSPVTAGEVIGQLEDDIAQLAVSRADATLDFTTKAAWRAREMQKTSSIPAAELETAEFQAKLANVAKREADQALERTRVVAPFDGVVTGRYVQPGRLLALNDTIVRITARRPLLARARVPESESGSLRSGSRMVVVTASGRRLDGRIRHLAPAVDAASGTREAIVQLGDVQSRDLLPGSTVSVELPRRNRRVLAVPRAAVSADGYVVIVEQRRTMMRPVVLGSEFGDKVEVLAGLEAGERVRARPR